MFGGWWQQLRGLREARALERRAIPDGLWQRTLIRYPFLRRQDPEDAAALRRMTSLFLDRKEFSTTGGLRLTDVMAVTLAAQAVLPVLKLGLQHYDGFVGIVVHPDAVLAPREMADDDGVVHAYEEVLAGEAMVGGPLMLSWHDARSAGRHAASGYNVVIHEFAHVLDMEDGVADGCPLLPPDLPAAEWADALGGEYERFSARVERNEPTALDPYGATAPEEFFAVASEGFFVAPQALKAEHPVLYGVFSRYYRQDPAAEPMRRPR